MGEDLNKEKKAIMKQWAKREQEIERVMRPLYQCMETFKELLARPSLRSKASTLNS